MQNQRDNNVYRNFRALLEQAQEENRRTITQARQIQRAALRQDQQQQQELQQQQQQPQMDLYPDQQNVVAPIPNVVPPNPAQAAYAALQNSMQNADTSLNLATDVKLARVAAVNQNWKGALMTALANGDIKGLTQDEIARISNNAAASQPRQYQQCSQEEIIAYIQKHNQKIPESMLSIMDKLFRGEGLNDDLKTAVAKAFVKYRNKNGNDVVSISIGKMYKPSDQASGYDKVVLLKARRIVKLIKQSIAAANMKNDLSMTKQYQAVRGLYNTYKLAHYPSARVQYARSLAKKIGALDRQSYNESLQQGKLRSQNHVNAMFEKFAQNNPENIIKLQQSIDQAQAAKQFYKNFMAKQIKQPLQLAPEAQQIYVQAQLNNRQRQDDLNNLNFPQAQQPPG